jgi:hypothetical protein
MSEARGEQIKIVRGVAPENIVTTGFNPLKENSI